MGVFFSMFGGWFGGSSCLVYIGRPRLIGLSPIVLKWGLIPMISNDMINLLHNYI